MNALKFPFLVLLLLCFACAKSENKKKKKSPSKLVQKAAGSGKKDKKVCEQNPQIITEEERLHSINSKLMELTNNLSPSETYSKDYLHKKSKMSEKSCLSHEEYNDLKANIYSYIREVFKQVTGKFKCESEYLGWLANQNSREKRIHMNHFMYFFNKSLEAINKNCEPIDLTKIEEIKLNTTYFYNPEVKKAEYAGFSFRQNYNLYCFPCQMENDEYESGILKK